MKYSRDKAIEFIQAILNGESRLDEWDALLSGRHRDPFTTWLAHKLSDIEENFSASARGRFLDDEGLRELSALMAGIQDGSAHDDTFID